MAFEMLNGDSGFEPIVICDGCERPMTEGFVVWEVDPAATEPSSSPVLTACSEECLDAIAGSFATDLSVAATPLDAYLASLVDRLDLDVAAVLERERSAWAAEQTRNEAPD